MNFDLQKKKEQLSKIFRSITFYLFPFIFVISLWISIFGNPYNPYKYLAMFIAFCLLIVFLTNILFGKKVIDNKDKYLIKRPGFFRNMKDIAEMLDSYFLIDVLIIVILIVGLLAYIFLK